jgi:hypothetical protein
MVILKYKNKKFDQISLDSHLTFEVLKEKIYSLTGVLPHNQKLFCRGQVFNENTYATYLFEKVSTVLLVGSTEDELTHPDLLLQSHSERPLFVEDLTHSELQEKVLFFIENRDRMDSQQIESLRAFINSVPDIMDIKYYDFTKRGFYDEFVHDYSSGNMEARYLDRRAKRLIQAINADETEEAKV